MTEKEEDVLNRVDLLLEAAKMEDNNYLIQALEQYDTYMKTRVPSANGSYKERFELEGIPYLNGNVRDCCVKVKRLPNNIVESYLKKSQHVVNLQKTTK